MKVRYRVLQSKNNQRGEWETIGVVYEREPDIVVPLAGPVESDVNRAIWREISRQMIELKVDLQNFHKAFGQHAHDYRLLTDIHIIEGDNPKQIRERLYEWYILGRRQEPPEIKPEAEKTAV